MWTSHDYCSAHAAYDWHDGAKACALYVFTMLALFVQGRLYLSSLSTGILASLNIVRPLVSLVATLAIVWISRERMASIGVTRRRFCESLALGLALGCLLSFALGACERIATGLPFAGFGAASAFSLLTFAVGALEEELCFRGYISTRLTGFFHNRVVASVVTGVLLFALPLCDLLGREWTDFFRQHFCHAARLHPASAFCLRRRLSAHQLHLGCRGAAFPL